MLLAAFVGWQGRAADPLVDLALLRSPRFAWGTVLATLSTFALMGLLFVLPQLFQAVQGADACGTGLRLLPIIGGLLVGARLAERLVAAVGRAGDGGGRIRADAAPGSALGAISDVGTATASRRSGSVWSGSSIGLHAAAGDGCGDRRADRGTQRVGSALIQALRQVGGTIGVAVLGTC